MKKSIAFKTLLILFISFCSIQAYAAKPVWSFVPTTATSFILYSDDTETVNYTVTNNSLRPHRLAMLPIDGVTPSGICDLKPTGQVGSTCQLSLEIVGADIPSSGIFGGPILCQVDSNDSPNPNQCYQPDEANVLKITNGGNLYSVGGNVTGTLNNHILILENNGDTLVISIPGPYTFSKFLAPGDVYNVLKIIPAGSDLNCSYTAGGSPTGTIINENITDINIHCSDSARDIIGSIEGLAGGGTLTLQNNNTDPKQFTINGAGQTFYSDIAQGSSYFITVSDKPDSQTCTVNNPKGIIGTVNVTDVEVTCSDTSYTIGGTVTGLDVGNETLTIQNNDIDDLLISANGVYQFNMAVAQGADYNVTISMNTESSDCSISNGSGTNIMADVNNANITCTPHDTSLCIIDPLTNDCYIDGSASTLLLKRDGDNRYFTVKNTGSASASMITATDVANKLLPPGTTIINGCMGGDLLPGNECNITIDPGMTASSDGTSPCTDGSGGAPQPSEILVSSANAGSVSKELIVLGYGCVYGNGYVFNLDDSPDPNLNIKGKVASNPSSEMVQWSLNTSIAVPNINNDEANCPFGDPRASVNGLCNRLNIIAANVSPKALDICLNLPQHSETGPWYLPAICELGYGDSLPNSAVYGCGTSIIPTTQNIRLSLVDNVDFTGEQFNNGIYWSSTQDSIQSDFFAWRYAMTIGPQTLSKPNTLKVVCAAEF